MNSQISNKKSDLKFENLFHVIFHTHFQPIILVIFCYFFWMSRSESPWLYFLKRKKNPSLKLTDFETTPKKLFVESSDEEDIEILEVIPKKK